MAVYRVPLTGPQLRVLNDVLSAVANDPDWSEFTGERDWATFGRGCDAIGDAFRAAARAESHPAAVVPSTVIIKEKLS